MDPNPTKPDDEERRVVIEHAEGTPRADFGPRFADLLDPIELVAPRGSRKVNPEVVGLERKCVRVNIVWLERSFLLDVAVLRKFEIQIQIQKRASSNVRKDAPSEPLHD